MERSIRARLVFTLFLVAFLVGTEGARDVPMKDEVYNPQGLFGPFGFGWPFVPFPFIKPWFGPIPFDGSPKAAAELKDMAKGNVGHGEVAKGDDGGGGGVSAALSP